TEKLRIEQVHIADKSPLTAGDLARRFSNLIIISVYVIPAGRNLINRIDSLDQQFPERIEIRGFWKAAAHTDNCNRLIHEIPSRPMAVPDAAIYSASVENSNPALQQS